MALPLTPETGLFPDTLVEPFIVSQDVADLADDVIASFDEFEPIQTAIREGGMAIAYVFETKPFDPLREEFKPHTIAKVTKASPRYQEVALLRSGIRIAEERVADLLGAIAEMCAGCEPEGTCRTPDCALRAFSPLPIAVHRSVHPLTRDQVMDIRSAKRWTPEARLAQSEMTRQLHVEGRISNTHFRTDHPANDPMRRESWLASIRATKARRRTS